MDELISRIKLEDGNIEFWKCRFLGEGLIDVHEEDTEVEDPDLPDVLDDVDATEDVAKEGDDEEVDEEEEEVEQTETENPVDVIKDKEKEVERAKPLQMIGVQLLKDSDETATTSKKTRRSARASVEVCICICMICFWDPSLIFYYYFCNMFDPMFEVSELVY